MSEIQRADPHARRKIIIFTVVVLIVHVPTMFWLNSYIETIEGWLVQPGKTIERAKLIIFILTAIGAALILLIAIFTFRFAAAVLHTGRYPPPDVKVIRDVRVHQGVSARKMGRLIQAFGIVVLLSLAFLIVWAWFLAQSMNQLAA